MRHKHLTHEGVYTMDESACSDYAEIRGYTHDHDVEMEERGIDPINHNHLLDWPPDSQEEIQAREEVGYQLSLIHI